jgi:hypothetical protein
LNEERVDHGTPAFSNRYAMGEDLWLPVTYTEPISRNRQLLPTSKENSDQPKIQATAHNPEATASTTAIKKAVGERRATLLGVATVELPLGKTSVLKSAVITSPARRGIPRRDNFRRRFRANS